MSDENREGKIDSLVDFFGENNLIIVDTEDIGSVVVECDVRINNEEDSTDKDSKYYYDELIDKGLDNKDIEGFNEFLDRHSLIIVKNDNVSGVSFENCMYDLDELYNLDLWKNEETN